MVPTSKRFLVGKSQMSSRNDAKQSNFNDSLNYGSITAEDDKVSNLQLDSEEQVDSICVKKSTMPCVRKILNSKHYTNRNKQRLVIYRSKDLSQKQSTTRPQS